MQPGLYETSATQVTRVRQKEEERVDARRDRQEVDNPASSVRVGVAPPHSISVALSLGNTVEGSQSGFRLSTTQESKWECPGELNSNAASGRFVES